MTTAISRNGTPSSATPCNRDPVGAAITAGFHGNSPRPDITTVPPEGVEPSHVVLASRSGDRSRLLAAFRKLAEAHLAGPARAQA